MEKLLSLNNRSYLVILFVFFIQCTDPSNFIVEYDINFNGKTPSESGDFFSVYKIDEEISFKNYDFNYKIDIDSILNLKNVQIFFLKKKQILKDSDFIKIETFQTNKMLISIGKFTGELGLPIRDIIFGKNVTTELIHFILSDKVDTIVALFLKKNELTIIARADISQISSGKFGIVLFRCQFNEKKIFVSWQDNSSIEIKEEKHYSFLHFLKESISYMGINGGIGLIFDSENNKSYLLEVYDRKINKIIWSI